MAVGVLGRAIAGLLGGVPGRAYVQLPISLRSEADALASAMNGNGDAFRCVLVVADRGPAEPAWVVPASDLLAWRTADDRAFVLVGGSVEPDSSFATSAVPFLTNAFPGPGGGTCTPATLAAATVREALQPGAPGEDALAAFEETAPWVLQLLARGLQDSPRSARSLDERILEGWAAVVADLEDAASAASAGGRALVPWDAWELVRLAGFPRPLLGRAASEPPPAADEVDASALDKLATDWHAFIDEHVRVGDVATILDRLRDTAPIPGTARWRGLDWNEAARSAQRFSASPPDIGRRLFATDGFADAAGRPDEWRAVSAENLREALSGNEEEPQVAALAGLLAIGTDAPFLLHTRQVVQGHERRPKSDRLLLAGIELEVSGLGRQLGLNLRGATDGTTVVEGVAISISPKSGLELGLADPGLSLARGKLQVCLEGHMEVKSRTAANVKWTPLRRLKIELLLRDKVGGQLQPARKVALVVPILVPSPYWPTVIAPDADDLPVSPAGDVKFGRLDGSAGFTPDESPELLVKRAGNALVVGYDGRWDTTESAVSGPSAFSLAGNAGTSGDHLDFSGVLRLANDAVLQMEGPLSIEATVIRIADDTPLPTNPLRRTDRLEALGEPSREAREAPLGRYQTMVAQSLLAPTTPPVTGTPGAATPEGSLFQLVMPSGLGELPSYIQFGPEPSAVDGAGGPWPGLGTGPSAALQETREWRDFTTTASEVARVGLIGGVSDWLSALDVAAVGAARARRYLRAHKSLVEAAINDQDRFWARYPFSVMLVNSARGPERGMLQAVFLSPMHPVRLGWLLGAQLHAEALAEGSQLLSLVDGWNYPATGEAPGPGGMLTSLVALPLDPGQDGDTAPWGALVPTSQHGIVRPPLFGAGARLPWGGRSGLNEKVVHQSLDDYLIAHPFLGSMQVELRSAVDAPRSAEVDRAVLSWARRKGPELGGTFQVLDSGRRLGSPPTRDDLLDWQSGAGRGRFAWLVRSPDAALPGPVDLAFVENAAPFTFVVPGSASAPVAPIPVKRFSVAVERGEQVDYHYAGRARDLFGLEDLLAVVEPARAATRVVTTASSIQAEREVRWEVIGDINMEPVQMARVARGGGSGKQLWEWRPGWLAGARDGGAVRGAHYVLAKAPRSLIAGLEHNLGLTGVQAGELLAELGGRGIGLATLRRPGTTQEGEAAGLFYAARLLAGFDGCASNPSWLEPGCHAGLVPLDPIRGVVASLAGGDAEESRADLALVILDAGEDGQCRLKIVPIECKHRGTNAGAAGRPSALERQKAAGQAAASASRLRAFQNSLASDKTIPGLVGAAARLQALATLVDLALKFGPNAPEPEARARAVQEILDGRAEFEVGNGLVVWSLSGPDLRGEAPVNASDRSDGIYEILITPAAVAPFIWSASPPTQQHEALRAELDTFLSARLGFQEGTSLCPNIGADLAAALGVEADTFAVGESRAGDPEDAVAGPAPPIEVRTGGHADPIHDVAADEVRAEAAGALGPNVQTGTASLDDTAAPVDLPAAPVEDAVIGEGASPSRADAFLGADESTRFTVVGELAASGQIVALDLDQPKALGVFGYMGSGKSYLLGTLIEGAAAPLPGLNVLRSPLSVVVFNYRRNAADRFELSSLTAPNGDTRDVERLAASFGATPRAVHDVHVLCLPGELRGRQEEYAGATASELRFKPSMLDVEDWELLMGEPGSDAVFARTIRTSLQDLRRQGEITVDRVREQLAERLQKGSLSAAELRLEAVDRIVSERDGVDFGAMLAPGRVLVVDLRQPMFNRDDAMKLILVCASQIAKQRTAFNKLVVFDEAHEYMTEAFGERFDARIRYMRHEGSSYVFATQDVGSVPVEIRRHLGTNFVFSLETRDNINDMVKAAPEYAGMSLQHLEPGTCYVTSARSTGNLFRSPRLVRVRPRATSHGGKSRIFDG